MIDLARRRFVEKGILSRRRRAASRNAIDPRGGG
jgi:hypothetical protein